MENYLCEVCRGAPGRHEQGHAGAAAIDAPFAGHCVSAVKHDVDGGIIGLHQCMASFDWQLQESSSNLPAPMAKSQAK